MTRSRVLLSTIILGCCVAALASRPSVAGNVASPDELGFRQLREEFHRASTTGDYDLMFSLWAKDAVFTTGGGAQYFGPKEITDFLAGNPGFGKALVVTSESKYRFIPHGNTADYGFECITVDVGGRDPLATSLAAPQGSQNPAIEVVRHTNTSGTLVRAGAGRWKFLEFSGAGGPMAKEKATGASRR
jgi:hypothetical protein